MGHQIGDSVTSYLLLFDSAQFVLAFLLWDLSENEPSLDVKENSVVQVHFRDVDDVHEANWVLVVSSYFLIDSYKSFLLLKNQLSLSAGLGKPELVPKHYL